MNTRALRDYRDSLTLSAKQRELLTGMLLGDAHLERRASGAVRLKVEHCVRQNDYAMWKYHCFQQWVLTPPQRKPKRHKLGSISENVWFNTIAHPQLCEWYAHFYQEGPKVIPENLALTPLALAVWFMDDGSRKSRECRGLYLNVQCFSQAEVRKLQACLRQNFQISTTTRSQSDGLQIYIPSCETSHFTEIVECHLIASMRYKLSG